jgi:hypothetical protein
MSDKKITELSILNSRPDDDDLLPIVHNGQTMATKWSYLISGDQLYTGAPIRTIYSRSNPVSYSAGSLATDLMFGMAGSVFGQRNIPAQFFEQEFTSKIIHFRTFGKFTNNTGSINVYILIGSDKILSSDIGSVSLSQPQGHPFEIFGEIVFNANSVTACYSIGHCANNGDFKRYPLSDPTITDSIESWDGGDIKIMFSSQNIGLTSYGAYIQVFS